MSTPIPPNSSENQEIDLIEVIRPIWNGRRLIAKVTGAFIVLGLIVAFTSTEQFKAEARLLPEIRDTEGGVSAMLRRFGGLGGINLPMEEGADAIRPDLYPDVLESTPFFNELMEYRVLVNLKYGNREVTVFEYVDEHMSASIWGTVKKYTIGLPGTIKAWVAPERENGSFPALEEVIPQMNRAQFEAVKNLRDRVKAGIDERSMVITISAEFPDRQVAAQIARFSVNYLTEYITEYRILKAQKNFEFIKERTLEKEEEFHLAQVSLARFRDANRNIISATVQTEEQRLQDQYNLAFNVYNNLALQLEQANIRVQEETPVIKVLEPVSVPAERSKPRRMFLLVIFSLLGFFSGLATIFVKNAWLIHVLPNLKNEQK